MSDTSTSNLMYLPYYMPDVSFNKVKYSNNLIKNGSILITDPDNGITDMNQKFLGNFKNDYTYQPVVQSTIFNIGFVQNNNNNITFFNGFTQNITESTKLNQNSIQNFNYNTIFGLTKADKTVIDWNYFGSNREELTDAIYSRLGPKLFYYNTGDYTTGNFSIGNLGTVSNPSNIDNSIKNLSNISGLTIYPVDPNLQSIKINGTTQINSINNIWPYKVQQKDTQYYSILTNGKNEALLALPTVELNTPTQYLLTTKFNDTTMKNEYSYTDLGDIIQNNYHYIVSYFDTRPTRNNRNDITFNSLISSIFNENLVQFMPLAHFTSNVCFNIHNGGRGSYYASCLPIAWTTTQPHTFPYTTKESLGNICPIRLEWGKNITITTEINYTCANMINLSNILSGWNYNDNTWKVKNQLGNNASRANVPYINAGLVLYVPNFNYNNYDTHYVGNLYINANNSDSLPKSKIFINLNNDIPTNYYINIAGTNVDLNIPLDSDSKYLPTVNKYEISSTYCICYMQTADINGVFYNITFVNYNPISSVYNKTKIFNDTDKINEYFKAYVTLSKSVTKSISYIYNNNKYTFVFNIGNNIITKEFIVTDTNTIVDKSVTFENVTIGLYKYKVTITNIKEGHSDNCTVTIELNDDFYYYSDNTNDNITINVIDFVVNNNNVDEQSFYRSCSNINSNDFKINKSMKYKQYFISSSGTGTYVTTLNNISNIAVSFVGNATTATNNTIRLTTYYNTSYNYTITLQKENGNLTQVNGNNLFGKFKNWLNDFGLTNFWENINIYKGDNTLNSEEIKNYLNSIYKNYSIDPPGDPNNFLEYQFNFSTPCCLPFDTIATSNNIKNYNNHFITSNNQGTIATASNHAYVYPNNNFLGFVGKNIISTSQDLVKLVNVFSVPITNALNTTHTATDTMTFRFEKPSLPGTTDYYYIIGIYLYLTKGIPLSTLNSYPHYIGFSPSTNILEPTILQGGGGGGVPVLLNSSFVKNTTNLYNDNYTNSILMKDYLTTPSIFMSINESTGNNL